MTYSLPDIAEKLGIHISVVENYEEEWLAEQENVDEDFISETFIDFLCRCYAECAFLIEAIETQDNAMACLEAYDEAFSTTAAILNND